MLKLVALPMVNQIAWSRDGLIARLRTVQRGEFAVVIQGQSEAEDDEVKRQLKPVLERILNARIGQLNQDLGAYGVDVLG
jgi:hypothetical protein